MCSTSSSFLNCYSMFILKKVGCGLKIFLPLLCGPLVLYPEYLMLSMIGKPRYNLIPPSPPLHTPAWSNLALNQALPFCMQMLCEYKEGESLELCYLYTRYFLAVYSFFYVFTEVFLLIHSRSTLIILQWTLRNHHLIQPPDYLCSVLISSKTCTQLEQIQ